MSFSNPTLKPTLVSPEPPKPSETQPDTAVKRTKPVRALPTDRITFQKQLDILRAYAAVSNSGLKSAAVHEVGSVVGMARETVSLSNSFFASIGLLQKSDGGYVPSPEVIKFQQAHEWNAEKSATKLEPTIRRSWFAETLLPRLGYGPMEEEQAIGVLADAASAAPEYRRALGLLIDYLLAAGLVQREGNHLKLVKSQPSVDTSPNPMPQETPTGEPTRVPPIQKQQVQVPPSESGKPVGGMNVDVSIQVEMSEIATWQPDRIAAFFNGIAQVLAAKAGIEKKG